MQMQRLAPDSEFLSRAARSILEFAAQQGLQRDLSSCLVVVPNLLVAPELARALAASAGRALLLPEINTLSGCLDAWLGDIPHASDARRQLILYGQLRRRGWLDETSLWDVAAELTAVFDTLTEHAVVLPQSEVALADQLGRAYDLPEHAALSFEARITHTLWQAEAQGLPSRIAARLHAQGAFIKALRGPFVFLSEGEVPPHLQALLQAVALAQPALLLQTDRAQAQGARAALLEAAWPSAPVTHALRERAAAIEASAEGMASFCLVAADSLEALAGDAVRRVAGWLDAGRQNIALIAVDRLAARRTRALLERIGVLVTDETGWKMATTRAAASVDALLEVLASDGWHRALADLLEAPFLFADLDAEQKNRVAARIIGRQVESGIDKGLDNLRSALSADAESCVLLERLLGTRRLMKPGSEASVAQWLQRLQGALDLLGAMTALRADAAGEAWLEWLEARRDELAEETQPLGFAAWRTWFNREMDATMFRDRSIESSVVLTHLAATRLRRFDAAVVLGADAQQLRIKPPPGLLAHAGVARELGLPGVDVAQARLREDMAGLVLSCNEVVFAWQAQRGDETVLPAPELALLQQVSGCGVERAQGLEAPLAELAPQRMPAPSVAALPRRLSASGLRTLIDCPYHYFTRHVLKLGEADELMEGLEKRHYGERFHAVLKAFHEEFPVLTGEPREVLRKSFLAHCAAVFGADVARNFRDHAWRIAAEARVDSYLDWQLAREQEGWRWSEAEVLRTRTVMVAGDHALELHGRLDRIDTNDRAAALSVLDYKTRSRQALRAQVDDEDDVQLAFYALLAGDDVAQAAYVALDDEHVSAVALSEIQEAADGLQARIDAIFTEMRSGARLPAHGAASACGYCEMRGVCRRDWFA